MRSEFSNKIDMLPRFGIRLFMPKDFSRAGIFRIWSYGKLH